jgi:hypothetical protein
MKNMRYITICAGILLALACGKDKPGTTPTIKIKSVSAEVVPINGILEVTLEFTDKEGDISDSLFMGKKRVNIIPAVSGILVRDSLFFNVPPYSNKARGEITLHLQYQNHLIAAETPPKDALDQNIADTIVLRFALQDKAKHTSDTVSTNKIVIIR